MTKELIVLMDGREAGRVQQGQAGRLRFTYNDRWRAAGDAYPLSLSMPLAAAEHDHAAIDAFLWGLLPDNEVTLGKWARRFQVSARNAFELIAHVGEDCAGAVQFVRPERLDELRAAGSGAVEWISEKEVAERLKVLRADHSAGRQPQDAGQFSLAGAQPKTALLFQDGRWGVPSGRIPTTHILKPPPGEFDGHALNEHLCLALARALGLPTARSEARRFEDEAAIVVERYDRVRTGSAVRRAHQEDMCQALGVHPAKKYQNEGGPGPKQIVELIRNSIFGEDAGALSTHAISDAPEPYAATDARTFVSALIFNWLIGGTDAHAKNYSLLIGAGGKVRLAPLYDLASILAYPKFDPRQVKLAMKIGDEYLLSKVDLNEWRKLAAQIRVDPDALAARARSMAEELPDRLSDEAATARGAGLDHPIIDTLVDVLSARARQLTA